MSILKLREGTEETMTVTDKGTPTWLGALGIAASPLTVATGVVVGHAPFEGLTGVPGGVAALLGVGMPLLFCGSYSSHDSSL